MTSRERVVAALNHQETDRVPIDLGGGGVVCGMQVSTVYRLRQALKLDPPGTPVKVIEPSQMLGEIKPDLLAAVGGDVMSVRLPGTKFGFPAKDWKPWTTFDGTPVLVPGQFNTEPDADGAIVQYPQNDRTCGPSAKMPKGGFYFDALVRQDPIDDEKLDPLDNCEEFDLISDADLNELARQVDAVRAAGKACVVSIPGTGFGDVGSIPAPGLKHPKGIRDIEEWYMSTATRPDYVRAVFERQCEIGLQNLARIFSAVGNEPVAAYVSGADFGAQKGPLISPRKYRTLYAPFQKRLNDWIHEHTTWKTFIHSCGSIQAFIPDMIDAGWDILNPVQTSAANMDPAELKSKFGNKVTFWGGGVDTQHTLPSATPDAIRAEVAHNLSIFARGGGYVFNPIHNVQQGVPVENLLAMYETVQTWRNA